MRNFFYPKSVAIFGVSDSPTNLGRIIVENLDRFSFPGQVYPIGVSGGFIGKKQIFRSLEEVDDTPELAVLLIPAKYVPGTLESCGKKGVGSIVLESSGFSELSDESKVAEEEILAIARRYGIRFVGPNCFGIVNMDNGLILPFFELQPNLVQKGGTSLISQSGGVLFDISMLSSHEKIGFNKLISVGNKLMTDENDCLEYLITDDNTKVICLYLESFSNGRRFMSLASSTDKPIILLKANRSEAGRQIAKFHTAALTGDDAVADAAMRQVGVHRVRSLREMVDLIKVFRQPPMPGTRLAIISRSGGHGVLAADAVERYGLKLSKFSDEFFDFVKTGKVNVIRTTNPLDVGDIYDAQFFKEVVRRAYDESDVDGVMFANTFNAEEDAESMLELVQYTRDARPASTKPIIFCMPSSRYKWMHMQNTPDYPIFGDVDDAILALARSYRHSRHVAAMERTNLRWRDTPRKESGAVTKRSLMEPRAIFDLFRAYDIPVADYAVAKDTAGVLAAAEQIGYPVALKIASPEVLHKTEQGGVKLGLADPESLTDALSAMKADAHIVQKMSAPGHEAIIGAKLDAEFGHLVLFGLGGIFAELFRDTAIRVTPIDKKTAMAMIDEIRGAAMFKGFRGRPPADIEALAQVLMNVSRLLVEHPEITFIDINPIIVFNENQGCIVVDAKAEHETAKP